MTTPRELALEALARATAATKGPWEDAQGSVWENGARKVTEEFVRCPGDNVALARTRDKVKGTRKLLKVFETDRDALVNVLSPYTGKTYPRRGKIVLKSTKVQPPKDQPPKVRA